MMRGEDLIDSTHRVLALRRALGHDDQPVYAHLPLILGPGGGKLSKRHGAVSVEEYRDAGYLPDALVNYLALLGWGPEDGREVLDDRRADRRVRPRRGSTPSAATFDPKKLEWMNGEHIRADAARRARRRGAAVRPGAVRAIGSTAARSSAAVALAQERATTLVQIAEQAAFLFVSDDELADRRRVVGKSCRHGARDEVLDAVIAFVEHCEWNDEDRRAPGDRSSSG